METAAIGLRREFKINNFENMCIYSIFIFRICVTSERELWRYVKTSAI